MLTIDPVSLTNKSTSSDLNSTHYDRRHEVHLPSGEDLFDLGPYLDEPELSDGSMPAPDTLLRHEVRRFRVSRRFAEPVHRTDAVFPFSEIPGTNDLEYMNDLIN